jgi:hypothetical protein
VPDSRPNLRYVYGLASLKVSWVGRLRHLPPKSLAESSEGRVAWYNQGPWFRVSVGLSHVWVYLSGRLSKAPAGFVRLPVRLVGWSTGWPGRSVGWFVGLFACLFVCLLSVVGFRLSVVGWVGWLVGWVAWGAWLVSYLVGCSWLLGWWVGRLIGSIVGRRSAV